MTHQYDSKKVTQWVLVLMFLSFGSFLVNKNAVDLQTSVIPTKQAPAFDGLAMPIQKSPIWASLTSAEYKANFENIPPAKIQTIPAYDIATLAKSTASLGWKDPQDLAVRNAQITYATCYMCPYIGSSNYRTEGAGSHLAVDIKVPNNTPTYSIGNGVVVKVANLSTGFGVHIVVRHNNFPSFDNPNVTTTYYSSYSHLSSAKVNEGDIVLKGQQIGLSGHTGDASTPHLHFQIDNSSAPWHPYWPFTYAEATAAGYDFGSAVSAGLGKDKAYATTINPVVYVQKYMTMGALPFSGTPSTVSTTPAVTTPAVTNTPVTVTTPPVVPVPTVLPGEASTSPTPVITNTPTPTPTPTIVTTPPSQVTVTTPVTLQVLADKGFVVGVDKQLKVLALDASGNVVPDYHPAMGVGISVENGGAVLGKSWFPPNELAQGSAETTFKPTTNMGLRFKATDGQLVGYSDILQSKLFTDVDDSNPVLTSLRFLKENHVIDGYPDGSFRPDKVVSRVEALKFIYKGLNKNLIMAAKLPFSDTSASEWYGNYLSTAFDGGVVQGYADRTFKPLQAVNKMEFFKMLEIAMGASVDMNITEDVFTDVPKEIWGAPYVAYAKNMNLIDATTEYHPDVGMTRAEVADVVYRMVVVRMNGQSKYTSNLAVNSITAAQYFKGV